MRDEQRNRHEHELRELEREIEKNADRADAARDAVLLRSLVAIGRITFARFDNTDEQLGRIELALAGINERLGTIMSELEDAQAAVEAVKADVANVQRVVGEAQASIQTLSQQVADLQAAAGENQALKDGLVGIATSLTEIDAQLDTVAPDAP